MKRMQSGIAVVVMVAATCAASAQDLWVGLRGGPSIPRLSGGGNEVSRGYESRLAPNVGVTAEYFLAGHFSVLTEVDYSGQGGVRKGLQPITQSPPGLPPLPPGQYLYGDFKNESILDYIEIPLLGKYEWELTDHWRCFAEGGPYVGFLLRAQERTKGTSLIYADQNRDPLTVGGMPLPPTSFDATTNVRGDLNRVNAGLMAGVGVAYLLDKWTQVFADVRGEYGLTNVQKNTDLDGKSHTGSAVFLLGCKFNFGR